MLTGLRTPGPRTDLFAAAPVMVNAEATLNAPDRPVRLTISHPVLSASATARTAGDIGGDLTLRVADVAALVPSVRGELTIDGHFAGPQNDLSLTAEASGDLAAGGMPPAAIRVSLQARGLAGTPTGKLTATARQASNRVNVDAALDERGQARLRLAADAYGARANAAGEFDTRQKLLSLSEFAAEYRDQRVALAGPARISVANGVDIQRLRLGFQKATLDVSGRAAPTLDLTGALHNLSASIADAFVPDLGAQGTVNADVRLTGSFERPGGTIRVTGSGLRLANGAAASFPPANVTATATLAGTAARINARATAGSAHFDVNGTAPLAVTGAIDLHTTGAVDLALLNRIVAARGTTVRGQATLDAAIAGTLTAPRAQGTLRLANGEVQDVVHGVHLQAMCRRKGTRCASSA